MPGVVSGLGRAACSVLGGAGLGEVMAGLSGTGRVADDLYLAAHHEVTWKPHLQPRALGIGLAGGLLAELMLTGAIRLMRGQILADGSPPPGDGLARFVLGLVAGEREDLAARDWLLYLGRTTARDVARRLEGAGYLTRAPGWRFGCERWVPVDPDWAFAPLVRVKSVVDARDPVPAQHVLLGALAAACGLGHHLALYLPPGGVRRLEVTRQLDPGLRELIAQTQAAVDRALLSHRA